MDKMQLIIKREFELASGMIVTAVEFTVFVMEIESDDDCFYFNNETAPDAEHGDDAVSFDFPTDWIDAVDA